MGPAQIYYLQVFPKQDQHFENEVTAEVTNIFFYESLDDS